MYKQVLLICIGAELQIRCIKLTLMATACVISSANSMFDHLLESSHRDDSNKWSNIEFGEEITHVESTEVNFMHFIWNSNIRYFCFLS